MWHRLYNLKQINWVGGCGCSRFWNLPIWWCRSLHNKVLRFSFGMTKAIRLIILRQKKILFNLKSADASPKNANILFLLQNNIWLQTTKNKRFLPEKMSNLARNGKNNSAEDGGRDGSKKRLRLPPSLIHGSHNLIHVQSNS